MRKSFIELERDQNADCARIDAAIRLAEREFANLSRRHAPEEARGKWTVVRDRTILAIRDVRRNIAQRASEARQIRARLIEECFPAGDDWERLARISRSAEELDARIAQLLCAHGAWERSCAAAPNRFAPSLVPEDHDEALSSTAVVDYGSMPRA
jgi:hypothetical protein